MAHNDDEVVKSLGAVVDRVMEKVHKYDAKDKKKDIPAPSSQKSYASDKYGTVEMAEDGKVLHPYDVDCPYCHNLKQSDMVANRDVIRTEQSMKMSGSSREE